MQILNVYIVYFELNFIFSPYTQFFSGFLAVTLNISISILFYMIQMSNIFILHDP